MSSATLNQQLTLENILIEFDEARLAGNATRCSELIDIAWNVDIQASNELKRIYKNTFLSL